MSDSKVDILNTLLIAGSGAGGVIAGTVVLWFRRTIAAVADPWWRLWGLEPRRDVVEGTLLAVSIAGILGGGVTLVIAVLAG